MKLLGRLELVPAAEPALAAEARAPSRDHVGGGDLDGSGAHDQDAALPAGGGPARRARPRGADRGVGARGLPRDHPARRARPGRASGPPSAAPCGSTPSSRASSSGLRARPALSSPGPPGFWQRVPTILGDGAFWRQQAYLLLRLSIGFVVGVAEWALLAASLGLVTLPIWYRWGNVELVDNWQIDTLGRALACVPVGIAGLAVALALIRPLASASRAPGRRPARRRRRPGGVARARPAEPQARAGDPCGGVRLAQRAADPDLGDHEPRLLLARVVAAGTRRSARLRTRGWCSSTNGSAGSRAGSRFTSASQRCSPSSSFSSGL